MAEITQSIKFKLSPTGDQWRFLKDYFSEYAKAVNFYLAKIPQLGGDKFKNINREKIKGVCSSCKKRTNLKFAAKENERTKLCGSCYDLLYGRKALYSIPGKRKRGKYDVHDASKLSGTEYALAYRRAQSTIRSIKQLHWEWQKRIWRERFKLKKWEEVRDNKIIKVEENGKKKKVQARIFIPKHDRQREDRYKHYFDREKKYQGKTRRGIERQIGEQKKKIENLNKRLLTKPVFGPKEEKEKRGVVDLQDSAVKFSDSSQVRLTLLGKQYIFNFWGEQVKNQKSSKFFREKMALIKAGKPRYPLLIQQSGEFYLQYPFVVSVNIPEPKNNFKAMGVDRGEKMIVASAIIDEAKGKPHDIKFFRSKDILIPKQKYEKIRKKIQEKFKGLKTRSRRSAKFGRKVKNISRYHLHQIAKRLVQLASNNKPIVIVMEAIKGIREEKGFRKPRTRFQKERNYLLSNFVYFTLQKLIEYKAFKQKIPVHYIDPHNTSQLCWRCGSFGVKEKTRFRCKKCKYQIHPDLNAAINIANKFYTPVGTVQGN